jgi:hypothetical protein
MARAHTAGKEKHGNMTGLASFACLFFFMFRNSCGGKKGIPILCRNFPHILILILSTLSLSLSWVWVVWSLKSTLTLPNHQDRSARLPISILVRENREEREVALPEDRRRLHLYLRLPRPPKVRPPPSALRHETLSAVWVQEARRPSTTANTSSEERVRAI